jgi:hypothetical protein
MVEAARARGEQLGFSEGERAFYDALETNDSGFASWSSGPDHGGMG